MLSPSQPYDWTFRRVVGATLVLVSVILGFWLLYRFNQVVVSLFIAIVLWIEPRLFRRKWSNPILTLVILLADVFGLIGIIVAPPLSVVCQILRNLRISNRLASGTAAQVSDLKERQARLWAAIKEMGELPPPIGYQ